MNKKKKKQSGEEVDSLYPHIPQDVFPKDLVLDRLFPK